MFVDKLSEQSSHLVNQATASADHAAKSTRRAANQAFESLADAVHDTALQLRETGRRASYSGGRYVRNEPVKAVLIAVVAGAMLTALAGLLVRSRR